MTRSRHDALRPPGEDATEEALADNDRTGEDASVEEVR